MNLPSLHIILADDDRDDCFLFSEAIEELSLDVNLTIVHDGEQLLEQLEKLKDNPPQALFLDLNMPRKNGFECLADIKNSEKLKDLPVIIYSTSYDKEIADRLYSKGAHFYIRKPSGFASLKNVIQEAIENVQETAKNRPGREQFVLTR